MSQSGAFIRLLDGGAGTSMLEPYMPQMQNDMLSEISVMDEYKGLHVHLISSYYTYFYEAA